MNGRRATPDEQAAFDGPKRLFPRHWFDQAQPRSAGAYLFKGLVDEGVLVVVYGASGCGKTFVVLDMACHLAADIPWRGKRVNAGLVVYIAAEAGESILRRVVAWRDDYVGDARTERVPLVIVTRGANLLDDVDAAELFGALEDISGEAKESIKLVVIDTLSRSIPGGDENSAHDMSQVVAFADRLRAQMGATTLVVHHSGKDAAKGARGHSALVAAADTVLAVADRVVTVEKVRDGVAGERFAFELEVVNMGEDAEGDIISTCIVRQSDTATHNKPRKEPAGRNQKVVLDTLKNLIAERGEALPATSAIPGRVRAVTFQDLCHFAAPKFPGVPAWRAKDRISQAIVGLQASSFVGAHNDHVWVW